MCYTRQTCGQYYDDGCLCDWTDDFESLFLEDEIERRGLQKRYMDALASTTNAMPFDNVLYPWSRIRATPEQRARAFLEAIAHDQP